MAAYFNRCVVEGDRKGVIGVKITFVVGSFPALSETFILNQITGLLQAGHEVKIFSGARSTDLVVHEDVVAHALMSHVRFYNDKPENRFFRLMRFLWKAPGVLLRAPKVFLNALNVMRYGKDAWSLGLFFRTASFLEAAHDDVVLCHFGQNGLVAHQMKEVGVLKGKIVTVFHASDITAFVWKEGCSVYKKLFSDGDAFLPISRFAKGKLIELGCPEQKITVHRMGVALKNFPVNVRKRFGTKPLRLLSVARLVEKKGIRFALEALRYLVDAGVECEYTIIGDGPLRLELEGYVIRLGIKSYVRFLGWQDSGAIRRVLKDADIFLAPSVVGDNKDEEGTPVVLMEAMASGVPVVTTPTGGIRELVMHGKTGFLVPQQNARSLAELLLDLWHHPQKMEKIISAARLLVEQEYNVDALNRVLERMCTSLLLK
jgi:colanic acid/amylovoran biosynthesis glycosyltransferase